MAEAMGNIRLANIIMLGALNEAEQILPSAQITAAFQEVFGASKESLIPVNAEALRKGAEAMREILGREG